ncbi:MAG: hypothetical protein ACO1N0_18970 [Fluviicola sp.]
MQKQPKRNGKPQRKPRIKNLTLFNLNPYVLRVFYILIGPLITIPVWDEKGPLRFIGLSLLFSGFHLLMLFLDLIYLLSDYLESKAPIKKVTPDKKRFSKVTKLILVILLICFIWSLKILDRTIHSMPVFWILILIGLFLGLLVVLWSVKKPFSFIASNHETYYATGLLLGIPMLLCSIFFISNRFIVTETIHAKPVEIVRKSIGSRGRRSGGAHYIFLKLDGKTERFTVGRAQHAILEDTVYCDLTKGIFGYYYIDRFSHHP